MAVNGRTSISQYLAATRSWTYTSPEGRTNRVQLDAKGRPEVSSRSGLAPIYIGYDTRGRIDTLTQGEGEDARITWFTYGPDGYLDSITDAETHGGKGSGLSL